jgi:hypothetical protein
MPTNRVNATLCPEDKEAVLAALKLVREKLPFLIDLSKQERKKLQAMGDTRYSFVRRALIVAEQCPDILPRNFRLEDYRRDVDLLDALLSISQEVGRLTEGLDDTTLELGAEAYASARTVYRAVKNDSRGLGLDETKKDLGRTFPQKPHKKSQKAETS